MDVLLIGWMDHHYTYTYYVVYSVLHSSVQVSSYVKCEKVQSVQWKEEPTFSCVLSIIIGLFSITGFYEYAFLLFRVIGYCLGNK